jgi:protein-tyrosine phosphatase
MNSMDVLFVCHANLCRSPMAERLMQARLQNHSRNHGVPDVRVASAGTSALVGRPAWPETAAVLRERGADAEGFVSRQVTDKLLLGADLVLTMSRRHRSLCVQLAPESVGRVFTLLQFARMAAAVPGPRGDLPALTAVALRARVQPVPPQQDDLPDPVGQPIEAFRICADGIERALDVIIGR